MKKVAVINHTHWDREWYRSFEDFRYRLMTTVNHIVDELEAKNMDTFFFDGQTVILEDYKEVVSNERYKRFEKLIKQNKISIGPWYVLPDEFLVSGESLIRNLQKGMEISKEHNNNHFIGYLPDTFGHISQLPQIFKKLGIDHILVHRGTETKQSECVWVGADGTECFTFILPLFEGYYQTHLSEENYVEQFSKYIESVKEYAVGDKLLSLHGADHLIPVKNLNNRIEEVKEKIGDIDIKQYSIKELLEFYSDIVPEEKLHGEQRKTKKAYLLPGVLSTRQYLKDFNQKCEDLLSYNVEPLLAYLNEEDAVFYVENLWKTLIKNHPHDSICGCSIDEVHSEMMSRNNSVLSGIERLVQSKIEDLANTSFKSKNDYLHIWYPNNMDGKSVPCRAKIVIGEEEDKGTIKLVSDNSEIRVKVLSREKKEHFVLEDKAVWAFGYVYEIEFMADLEGNKINSFKIVCCEEEEVLEDKNDYIENDFFNIRIENNELVVLDKKNNKEYKGLNTFVEDGDAGDSYNYSPPENDKINVSKITDYIIEKKHGIECINIKYEIEHEECLSDDRTSRIGNTKTVINSKISLYNGNPIIRFNTTLDNNAKNHRIRLVMPLDKVVEGAYSDTPFDIEFKGILRGPIVKAEKGKESEINLKPTSSIVSAGGIEVLHRGLNEYEVNSFNSNDAIFMTMLRGIDWLSTPELFTRGGGAGPKIRTYDSQCLGKNEYIYGVTFNSLEEAFYNTREVRVTPVCIQGKEVNEIPSLLKIDNKKVVVSALKIKNKEEKVLRIFNPSQEIESVCLNLDRQYEIHSSDFREESLGLLSKGNSINIEVKPKEVKTLILTRGEK